MPRPSLALLLAALALPAAAPHADAALALREDFALSHPGRPGQPLHGSLASDGASTWIATPNLLYAATETSTPGITVTSVRGYVGKLPLPRDARVVRLTATLSPASSDQQNNWAGLGVGNPGEDNFVITWPRGLLLLVHADGRYTISHENPQAGADRPRTTIQSEIAPGHKAGRPVAATLQYDATKGTVSAWINNRHVLDNYDLKSRGVVPDLSFAGFSGYHQPADRPPVSAFSLETLP